MKKIYYMVAGHTCITICPYRYKTAEDEIFINRVGSLGCSECPHFVSHNKEDDYVMCSYEMENIIGMDY